MVKIEIAARDRHGNRERGRNGRDRVRKRGEEGIEEEKQREEKWREEEMIISIWYFCNDFATFPKNHFCFLRQLTIYVYVWFAHLRNWILNTKYQWQNFHTFPFYLLFSYVQDLFYKAFGFPEKALQGELALVTGGGGGLGRLLALRLSKLGVDIVIWDINQEGMLLKIFI